MDEIGDKAVTHLFAIFFFSTVLGFALAAIWGVLSDNRERVLSHLPWKDLDFDRPPVVIHSVRRNGLAC